MGRLWLKIHHVLILLSMALGLLILIPSLMKGVQQFNLLKNIFGSWVWVVISSASLSCVFLIYVLARGSIQWYKKQWDSVPLASFRFLFCFLIIGMIIKLAFIPHYSLIPVGMIMGTCVGIWSLIMLVKPWQLSAVPRKVFKALDFVLFNICLLLLVAEICLCIIAYIHPSPLLIRDTDTVLRRIDQYRYEPGTLRYGFTFNEQGHYDTHFVPKEEGTFLVASIGDSFSTGIVAHCFHYTTVCERNLPGCTVYNMGFPCIGPVEYLHLLRFEALCLMPDLILINLFIGNDIVDCARFEKDRGFIHSLFNKSNYFLYLLPLRFAKLERELADTGHEPGTQKKKEVKEGKRYTSIEEAIVLYPIALDPMKEKPPYTEEAFLRIESTRAKNVCIKQEPLYPNLFSCLEETIQAVGDVPLSIMLIPDEFQVNDLLWEEIQSHLDGIELERFLPQQVIKQWLEEKNIPYLDLLPHLLNAPLLEDGQRHCYHVRDTHFNARGNEIVGKAMADFISSQFITTD